MSIILNGTELTDLNFNGVDITEAYFNNVKIFEKGGAIGTLEETSWADIARVSALGTASDYWAVGDTKTFDLSNGETMQVAIADFNHDNKTDGTGKAGITFVTTHRWYQNNRMHSSATTTANIGWDKCEMRLTRMPAFLALFPNDLQGVIKTVNKPTAMGYGQQTIVNSEDKLWLLSEKEWNGSTTFSYANEGVHYPYFTGKGLAGTLGYGSSTACDNWTRSPSKSDRTRYVLSTYQNAIGNYGATATVDNRSVPISCILGFCI